MSDEKTMVYWNPNTKGVYGDFQLPYRTEEELAQLIPIEEDLWNDILDKVNNQGKMLTVDEETKLPKVVDQPEPTEAEKAQIKIMELKDYLNNTDWKAIKASELGIPLSELYPDDNTKRSEARAKINELEKLLT